MIMEPKLVNRDEFRKLMVCEECGITASKRPWAEGWTGWGRSRIYLFRDTIDPAVGAHWCPVHSMNKRTQSNPSVRELRQLRERLLEAEQDAVAQRSIEQSVVKWSARREGLIPMAATPNREAMGE